MTIPLDDGIRLHEAGKHEDAFRILLPLARLGVPQAQEIVGVTYQLGLCGDRNVGEAFHWLSAAAEGGSAIAAHNLGTLYQTCEPDRPGDIAKSLYWFCRAREMGFTPSGP